MNSSLNRMIITTMHKNELGRHLLAREHLLVLSMETRVQTKSKSKTGDFVNRIKSTVRCVLQYFRDLTQFRLIIN